MAQTNLDQADLGGASFTGADIDHIQHRLARNVPGGIRGDGGR